jgi:hypothetical protein
MAQEPKGVSCHMLVEMEADDDDVIRSVTNCSLWLQHKIGGAVDEGVSTDCHLLAVL